VTAAKTAIAAATAAAALAVAGAEALRREEPRGAERPSPAIVLFVSTPPAGDRAPAHGVAAGSRILAVPLGGGGAPPRVLAEGFAAAASPRVSFDGTEVLFAGRRAEGEADAIWAVKADGSGVRRVAASAGGDCGSPAWLPDGRVLFTAPAPGFRGRRSAGCRAIFTVAPDGTGLQRLTFYPGGADIDPEVLADGRILFARDGEDGTDLLAVHNDGTGVHPFHGAGLPRGLLRRPREAADRGLWVVGGGRVLRIDARRPERAAAEGAPGLQGEVRDAEPLPDGGLLVSVRPAAGRTTFGVRLLAPGGPAAGVPVAEAPDRDSTDPVLLAPRPRPKGHLSVVKPEKDRGSLYCIDARRTARGHEEPLPAAVRLYEALPAGDRGLVDDSEERFLGEQALEPDGSFYVVVPADRPIRVEAVDAEGKRVRGSGFSLWVRPNEIRACIGCHEDPAAAPPNALPAAVLKDPVDLARPDRAWRTR
jgi:hypothetical protein